MAGFDPSKGGSSLAQSFMQNRATQPTGTPGAAMPAIQQPIQAPMDFGSMAPRPVPQQAAPQATPFGDMSQIQRLGMMMGGRMNPTTGKMDLPTDMDRGSVLAARNAAKGSMLNGGENPFSRIFNPHRGGSR